MKAGNDEFSLLVMEKVIIIFIIEYRTCKYILIIKKIYEIYSINNHLEIGKKLLQKNDWELHLCEILIFCQIIISFNINNSIQYTSYKKRFNKFHYSRKKKKRKNYFKKSSKK